MKIVTGRTGELHVTSDDDRHLHAGTFGEGKYILNTASKLNATNPSSNVIRLAKGDIMFQGCHARIEDYEDVDLNPGTEGYSRIDLICCQYKKVGGVESTELVVYQGTPAVSNPATPAPTYQDNNILDGADIADMPLYKITISGVNVSKIERVASIESGLNEMFNLIYPIGSIYMSAVSTDPSILFPGTTWVAWGSGRVPVGVNGNDANFNVTEKTGGQSTITIGSNNIPAHSHTVNDSGHGHTVIAADGAHNIPYTDKPSSGKVAVNASVGYFAPTESQQEDGHWHYNNGLTSDSSTTGISLQNAYGNASGGADPITNLQPYITCYMWKRTN